MGWGKGFVPVSHIYEINRLAKESEREVGGFDRRAIERRSRRERMVAYFPPPSYGRLLVLPITVQFTRSLGRGRSS